MKKKSYLLLWIIALLLYVLIMPLRAVNFQWASVAHSVAFTILTWWALTKYAHKAEFWIVMLPLIAPWLFELVVRLFISDDLFSLSVTVMPLWAVVTTALFYRQRKIWLLLPCAILWLYGVTEGHKQWVEWVKYNNKPVGTVNLADCEVTDGELTFMLSAVKSDYIVLDVWYSKCGVCLREMPNVEALRNEYKDTGKVEVVSLFVKLINGETAADGQRIMKELGCDIPVYTIDAESPILKKCDIQRYPRVLILDKDKNVIFNGSLEFAKRKLIDIL